MGADRALLSTSKYMYQTQNPEYGDELARGFEKATERFLANELLRKKEEERLNEKIEGYISQFPPNADISNVPDNFRPKLTQYLTGIQKKYADAAGVLASSTPGSDEYIRAKNIMDQQFQLANNMSGFVQQYNALSSGAFSDWDNKNLSAQNDMSELNEIYDVFTGKTELDIQNNKLGYIKEDGSFVSINEIKSPALKATKEATQFDQIIQSAIGGKIRPQEVGIYINEMQRTIEDAPIEVLKSLAMDDLHISGIKFVDKNRPEYQQIIQGLESEDIDTKIASRLELSNMIVQNYNKVLKSFAEENYKGNKIAPDEISLLNLYASKGEQFAPFFGFNESEEKDPQQLAGQLNLMLQRKKFFTEYDPETEKFSLLNTANPSGFVDTQNRYDFDTNSIAQMLKDVDGNYFKK